MRAVAPDEPADRIDAKEHGGIEDTFHERVLFRAQRRIGVQHVVEVADLRHGQPVASSACIDAPRPLAVEWLPQVERVGHRIQHRGGRHVSVGGMERRRQLNRVGAELVGERNPVLDRAIGIEVAHVPRGQFLERRREDADLHEPGRKSGRLHGRILQRHSHRDAEITK